MRPHVWKNIGPIYSDAKPEQGFYWGCERCGNIVRSNEEPYELSGNIMVTTPISSYSYPALHADCDTVIVRAVMDK
jgi:hypothetical protein